MSIIAGPYRYVNKADSRKQKTVCVWENPTKLETREYFEGREDQSKRVTIQVEDLTLALVRLTSQQVLLENDGFQNQGIGNATKGEAPKELPKPQPVLLAAKPDLLIKAQVPPKSHPVQAKPVAAKPVAKVNKKTKTVYSSGLVKVVYPCGFIKRIKPRYEPVTKNSKYGLTVDSKGILRSLRIAKLAQTPDYKERLSKFRVIGLF